MLRRWTTNAENCIAYDEVLIYKVLKYPSGHWDSERHLQRTEEDLQVSVFTDV